MSASKAPVFRARGDVANLARHIAIDKDDLFVRRDGPVLRTAIVALEREGDGLHVSQMRKARAWQRTRAIVTCRLLTVACSGPSCAASAGANHAGAAPAIRTLSELGAEDGRHRQRTPLSLVRKQRALGR